MRAVPLRSLSAFLLLAILPWPAAAGAGKWTHLGPDGGSIYSLAADPSSPGTIYAGTDGGVWKSVDGGGHWVPTPPGFSTGLAFATSPGRVWAGVYNYYFLLHDSRGIFLLTEGASAWRQVGPVVNVTDLAVDPTDPDRVWVVTDRGEVFVSEDGGEHWRLALALSSIYAVAIAPTAPATVYVGGSDGIFSTTDAGTTWRQVAWGLGTPVEGPRGTYVLLLDPLDPDVFYTVSDNGSWKTRDAGATWSPVAGATPFLALPGALLGVGTGGLARSEDGGASWARVAFPDFQISALAADPANPEGAWLGTQNLGAFRTLDGGRTWVPSRRGLSASTIYAFAFDPFRPRTLYTATGLGRQRSVDGGASWTRLDRQVPSPGSITTSALAADPKHPGTLYAVSHSRVVVSRDRGDHWQPFFKDPIGNSIRDVAVDPHRPATIFAGGDSLFRSRDGGRTWKDLPYLFSPFPLEAKIEKILISPWHPETVYILVLDSSFRPDGLQRSTDGGNTWESLPSGVGPADLAFAPGTPDLLYVAATDAISRSHDGGTTWEPVAGNPAGEAPLIAILVDPRDPLTLYVGSDGNGIWRSRDGGATWEPFSSGVIPARIFCLAADPRDPRRLIACTEGGGLLEIRLQP